LQADLTASVQLTAAQLDITADVEVNFTEVSMWSLPFTDNTQTQSYRSRTRQVDKVNHHSSCLRSSQIKLVNEFKVKEHRMRIIKYSTSIFYPKLRSSSLAD
jgi:hypothetical protein